MQVVGVEESYDSSLLCLVDVAYIRVAGQALTAAAASAYDGDGDG